MTLLERSQHGAVVVAVIGGVLGLATAGGCSAMPAGPSGLAGLIHGLLFVLGAGGGILAALRIDEVEEARWSAAKDPLATKGEREYAHREAESQRRVASTAFLLAPIGVGYWLAYVFETEEQFSLSDLFLVTPLLGFFLALLITSRLSSSSQQDRDF